MTPSVTGQDALPLRVAAAGDVPAVVALVQSAYRGEESRAGWTTEADLLAGQRTDADEVAEVIAAPRSLLLLRDGPDGRPLACCRVADAADTEGGVAYLGMLTVTPAAQGDGTGRRVLAAAEALAAERLGARAVEMTVIAQRTDLIAWYRRRGYAATGARRPFPYGDERFGVPLRDDLEFVVLRRELEAEAAPTEPPAAPRTARSERTDGRSGCGRGADR